MGVLRVLVTVAMIWLVTSAKSARADIALLMEEPFGTFGAFNPTGHAAVYLSRVCSESPIRLRPCHSGEAGVVISRYYKIGGFDWIAIPLVPYLYAVERQEDIPATVDAELEMHLRDAYRRHHLLHLISDASDVDAIPRGNWVQLVGASYDRTIYGFRLETAYADDERLIAQFNDRKNVSHFNLLSQNCADFARVLINDFYPHAVRRNFMVDFGVTTPKQDAKSLTKYAKRHRELAFSTFVIPQVPGSIHRSRPVHDIAEALVKSKKYVAVLVLLSPEVTAGLLVAYLVDGRFQLSKTVLPLSVEGQRTPGTK